MTVTEALLLHHWLEDWGQITESIHILVPVNRIKQKCFQITTKRIRRSQQFQLHLQHVACSRCSNQKGYVADSLTCLRHDEVATLYIRRSVEASNDKWHASYYYYYYYYMIYKRQFRGSSRRRWSQVIAISYKWQQNNAETRRKLIIIINNLHFNNELTSYLHLSSSRTNPSNKLLSLSLDHPVAFFSVLKQVIKNQHDHKDTKNCDL